MSGLLSLANELLQSISDHCQSLNDVKNLRLICVAVNQAIEEGLYSRSKLSINVNRQNLEHDMAKIVELSTGAFIRPGLVRHLRIGNLAPEYDPKDNRPWIRGEGGQYTRPPKPEPTPEVIQALDGLTEHLSGAVKSLVRLKSLSWSINDSDPEWTYQTVLDSIAEIPSLSEVDVYADFSVKRPGTAILPLDKLPPMRKVKARVSSKEPWRSFYEPLSKCIARSDKLESLSLDSGHSTYRLKDKADQLPVFNELIKDCPPTLPLVDLALTGWKIDTTQSLIDRLQNVRNIRSCTWDSNILDQSVLTSLRTAGVCLRSIETGSVDSAMLHYTGSYSGIRTLHMRIPFEAHPDLYRKFYDEVLPLQKLSLEVLSIKPFYEGLWCFDEAEGEALASCPNLKDITLALNCKMLGTRPARGSGEESTVNYSPIKSLLDTFAFHPSIRKINLVSAGNPANRGARCGNPRIQYSKWASGVIAGCLEQMAKEIVVESGAFHPDFCLTAGGITYQARPRASENVLEWIVTKENKLLRLL